MYLDEANRYVLTCSDLFSGIEDCTQGAYEFQCVKEKKRCILFLCSKHLYKAHNHTIDFTTFLKAALQRVPGKPPDELDELITN